MKKGMFIVIEGIDGSGKGTQTRILCTWLKKQGYEVFQTHEPTDSKIGKIIREGLKEGNFDPIVEALLFAADRAEHVKEVVQKINEEKVVISDRYLYSSLAYQGAEGVDEKWLNEINKFFPKPDVVIYLDLSPEVGLKRISSKKLLRSTQKEKEYLERKETLEKVRKNYLEQAKENSQFFTINAENPKKKVQTSIRRVIGRLLPSNEYTIIKKIRENPGLIEDGLKIEEMKLTDSMSFFDFYGKDRNNNPVFIEVKKSAIGMSTVALLDKNITAFKQKNPNTKIRVFLIAPEIPPKVKNLLIKKGIEHKKIKFDSGNIEDTQSKLKKWE